ncbi:MAG: D-alanyl-D-alanine carboxypeptidase family protein [Pyrinomonadaceae bacterium]
MKLTHLSIKSIYPTKDGLLPARMAQMTPDAAAALDAVRAEVERRGGCFRVSDMYRDAAMQARAHQDYVSGRKKAYSPPAGGSMHQAGRAIDLDLAALIHPDSVPKGSQLFNENDVRAIFEAHGWTFIAPAGNPHRVDVKESWHIEYRAKFQAVYDATMAKLHNHGAAYKAMAKAAIADVEV